MPDAMRNTVEGNGRGRVKFCSVVKVTWGKGYIREGGEKKNPRTKDGIGNGRAAPLVDGKLIV